MPSKPQTFCLAASSARLTFKKAYDATWKKLRQRRLDAEPLCRHCADQGYVTAAEQVDHIKPLATGGRHEWENTQSLCIPCHRAKTHRDLQRSLAS